ncbi:MAG TPA: LTA synthase family protein, partial [Flavobacteriales bacterium]
MRIPAHLSYLLRSFLAFLVIGSLFRLLLLVAVMVQWAPAERSLADVLTALLNGIRFDTVVAGYVLLLPFLLLSITALIGYHRRGAMQVVHLFLCGVGILYAFLLAADIPYFLHFFAHLSSSALLWTDDAGYMLGMIAREPSFWMYLVPFVLVCWALVRWSAQARDRSLVQAEQPRPSRWVVGSLSLLTAALLLLGIRGRVDEKSPIRKGTAYFSQDPFLNQLGSNAAFTFGTSMLHKLVAPVKRVELMDAEEAVRLTAGTLGAVPGTNASPIARPVRPEGPARRANVVIVLLESMSVFKTGLYNGPPQLTPFLNGLKERSLSFDRTFSAGIHTFNGIYSTLYSFPALYDQQPLEELLDREHAGIGKVLGDQGWGTVFFTTHDAEFDNMRGFLLAHGFDRVVSEDDYPSELVVSTNGIPDHRLFEQAMPILDELAEQGPFLSVMLTTSDHKPYIIPEDLGFRPRSEDPQDRIVEYVDRSVQHLFEMAARRPWYDNTIFVLLGDHGINMGHTYDMPLSFHHTPLIIHAPDGSIPPQRIGAPCGQIDVAPTVLGLLDVPWTNTTLGMDVLNEQRPCIAFCADDRIGCLDSTRYFIHRADGRETLYRYADLSTDDLS